MRKSTIKSISEEMRIIGQSLNRIEDMLKCELDATDDPTVLTSLQCLAGIYISIGNMCSLLDGNLEVNFQTKEIQNKDN